MDTGQIQSFVELVRCIVKAIVDDVDNVRVDGVTAPDGTSTEITVCVSPREIGKVIGKNGNTSRSLRVILNAAGMKFHHRFTLNIPKES
jgi:predicted RNA-binding protein YlqC (UPF0109 family)